MGSSERKPDNRPQGVTGLQQAIEAKNNIKREKKISKLRHTGLIAQLNAI